MTMDETRAILQENDRRNDRLHAPFDPITGEGSTGRRVRVEITDFVVAVQWLPEPMMEVELVKRLVAAGSIRRFLIDTLGLEPNEGDASKVARQLIRVRCRHDFPFWCALLVKVKKKGGATTCSSGCGGLSGGWWRPSRRAVWRGSRYA